MTNSTWTLVTDFGSVELPEKPPEFPTKKYKQTRYNEYDGTPYKITTEYSDYSGPGGKQWLEYEKHVNDLAEATWRAGGGAPEIEAIKVPPFSEWVKGK